MYYFYFISHTHMRARTHTRARTRAHAHAHTKNQELAYLIADGADDSFYIYSFVSALAAARA